MATRKVDYRRGVMKNVHRSGVDVYMYVDQPGVYMDAYENELDEKFAREAGFDVERYGKARRKRELMAQAMATIEASLDDEHEAKVVEDRDGFKLVNLGLDRFVVEDPDGQRLTPTPLGKALAIKVLDSVQPKAPEVKEPKPEAKGPKPIGNPNASAKGTPIELAPEKAEVKTE